MKIESREASRSKEVTIELNRRGRRFLKAIYAAIRTSRFHDPNNEVFNKIIQTLMQDGDALLNLEGKAEFRMIEDQFFLNGLWIKSTLAERETLFSLADELFKLQLGGMTVQSQVPDANWRRFFQFAWVDDHTKGEGHREINQALSHAGIESIVVHPLLEVKDEDRPDLPFPSPVFKGVTLYAKLMSTIQDFAQSAQGDEQVTILRKAQRVVCDVIELAERFPRLLPVLSLLRTYDTYFLHHSVNTLLLSTSLGQSLAMTRKELVDLGMAALFHDVGKLRIPDSILNKKSKLTAEEWQLIRRHPIESAKTFLSLGYLTPSVIERALLAFQHHWANHLPDSYPVPRRPIAPTFISKLAGLAIRYDSLTTPKEYVHCLPPWLAMAKMYKEHQDGAYQGEIFRFFLRSMGPVPVGSWVALTDGTEGLVAVSGAQGSEPARLDVFVPETKTWHEGAKSLKVLPASPPGWERVLKTTLEHSEGSPLLS